MQCNFARELSEIRREINEQKSAQARALGAMNFYKKTASYDYVPGAYADNFFKVIATAKSGALTPIFVQLYQQDTNDYVTEKLDTDGITTTWSFYFFNADPVTLNFTAIASADFDLKVQKGQA